MASEAKRMTHARALRLWVTARERAVDELSSRAERLSREGRKQEAASLRGAARILRLRLIQEQTQAQAYEADETTTAREVAGRGHPGSHGEYASERVGIRREAGVRGHH